MQVIKYDEIESTHNVLKKEYLKYEDKTVIIADKQTAGIGTHGRSWFTGSNKNIALSFLFKPKCEINSLNGITVKIAKMIQEEIYKLYNVKLEIKKPNDLIIDGKKICGILTEVNTIGDTINYLIISIGFNVNENNFPDELNNIATSLYKQIGKGCDKDLIIERLIKLLENIF